MKLSGKRYGQLFHLVEKEDVSVFLVRNKILSEVASQSAKILDQKFHWRPKQEQNTKNESFPSIQNILISTLGIAFGFFLANKQTKIFFLLENQHKLLVKFWKIQGKGQKIISHTYTTSEKPLLAFQFMHEIFHGIVIDVHTQRQVAGKQENNVVLNSWVSLRTCDPPEIMKAFRGNSKMPA